MYFTTFLIFATKQREFKVIMYSFIHCTQHSIVAQCSYYHSTLLHTKVALWIFHKSTQKRKKLLAELKRKYFFLSRLNIRTKDWESHCFLATSLCYPMFLPDKTANHTFSHSDQLILKQAHKAPFFFFFLLRTRANQGFAENFVSFFGCLILKSATTENVS